MIASLRGRLVEVRLDGIVVEVGGVGYRVFLTPKAAASLTPGAEVLVHTVTYVREDTLALYGFLTGEERRCFELLLTATGVGPKLALAILSVHAPDALRRALSAGDVAALTLVPGVGRKGAARLLLELRGKLGGELRDGGSSEGAGPGRFTEVAEALASLGYGPAEIKAALAELPSDGDADPQTMLRLALRVLAVGT